MIDEITAGTFIKLFFSSGLIAEGIVKHWSDSGRSITSNNGDILLVNIDYVAAIKIINIEDHQHNEESQYKEPQYEEPQEPQSRQQFKTHDSNIEKLASLSRQKQQLELEEARRRLLSFEPSEYQVKYGYPRISQQSADQHSGEESKKFPPRSYRGMRSVPRKKS